MGCVLCKRAGAVKVIAKGTDLSGGDSDPRICGAGRRP